jgi:hypothetical protein
MRRVYETGDACDNSVTLAIRAGVTFRRPVTL